jgi:hypothetical protein
MRPYDPDAPPRCPMCRDTGAVIVPHPRCVDVRAGRLVTWPGSPGIRTCAVACTCLVPDPTGYPATCSPGAALAAGGLMSWDRYTERVGGLDGVFLLAELEEQRAALARGGADDRPPAERLRELFPRLADLLARGTT